MSLTDDDDDAKPQRPRRPIAGTGWLLFVCAFLPTLRVCSDPISPFMFPPVYVVYLGAAAIAVIAMVRTLRARRGWFTAWFVLWLATALTWAGLFLADVAGAATLVVILGGLVGMVFAAAAFHRARYTERGMWIGGIVRGSLSTIWYLLLATDHGAMWGAYVGLASSVAFIVASAVALAHHVADLARKRRETEPAPLPVARIVHR